MLNYSDYIALFNTGDDAALVERFFADDLVFSGGSRDYQGKDGLMRFLGWAHDGVREVMRPQNILQRDDLIFAEIDMDFHAVKERADFPFGHLQPGDLVTVKFFVTYRLRDDKVVELKSMTWPPEKGVTKLPRLGAHPSQLAAFRAYASAFSNADFERFPLFYQPDVAFKLGDAPLIHGRDGIVDFYRPIFARVREHLTVHDVQTTDDAIRLDATSRFTALADAPDFVVGPLKQGEFTEVRVLVNYVLKDGLIARITVTRAGEPAKHGG